MRLKTLVNKEEKEQLKTVKADKAKDSNSTHNSGDKRNESKPQVMSRFHIGTGRHDGGALYDDAINNNNVCLNWHHPSARPNHPHQRKYATNALEQIRIGDILFLHKPSMGITHKARIKNITTTDETMVEESSNSQLKLGDKQWAEKTVPPCWRNCQGSDRLSEEYFPTEGNPRMGFCEIEVDLWEKLKDGPRKGTKTYKTLYIVTPDMANQENYY